jgi:ATP-binding cassette subfamily F protein uup
MAKQPRARQAKSQSRQDAFYKLQDAAAAVPVRMGTLDVEEGVRASRLGDIAVELKNASLSLGDTPILRDFSYAFSKGERVGIVGGNGVGKTTFLNICRGLQAVTGGAVVIGETVRFGYYEQHVHFEHPEQRVADYVTQLAADAREDDVDGRDWNGWTVTELLKRFQFMRGRQATPLCELSGGEKRRLQLLTVLSKRPNFLIMDEVSTAVLRQLACASLI